MTGRVFSPSPKAHRMVKHLHVLLVAEQITLTDLAERALVDTGTLSRWWSGATEPRLSLLENCFEVFGMSLKMTRMPEKAKPNGSEHVRRHHA